MGKKYIAKEKKQVIIEVEKKGKYIGAEWIGAELISGEFGKLEKGKIYPMDEQRANNTDGFKSVYK